MHIIAWSGACMKSATPARSHLSSFLEVDREESTGLIHVRYLKEPSTCINQCPLVLIELRRSLHAN
jgi:hypothetical protein